ncbi:hypothetical protein KEM48_000339, partial [Puccinia striiformis f. sp. tritici PST-130]
LLQSLGNGRRLPQGFWAHLDWGQGSGSIKYAKDKDQEFFGALINMIEALEKIEKLMAKEERKKKKHCMARDKVL